MKTMIIIIGILLIFGISLAKFIIYPIWGKEPLSIKTWGITTIAGILCLLISGSFYYAEPGYSYLVQYPWGTQKADLNPGYHFYWYGTVLNFKKVVTVRLTDEADKESETSSAMDNSVLVRFNDSVRATVSSSTRFRLPEDETLFLKLAVDYRNQSNLVMSSLVPVTKEVIRNSARELSAQDYVTGQGGQFEANVLDQLENGIVVLELKDGLVPTQEEKKATEDAIKAQIKAKTDMEAKIAKAEKAEEPESKRKCEPNDAECEADLLEIQAQKEAAATEAALAILDEEPIMQLANDRGIETKSSIYRRVVRIFNEDGTLKRKKHPIEQYGILVTQSTIESVQPEEKFQEMLGKQRDAAAAAAVSRQEAKQAQYEKQKIIAQGETEKARTKMSEEQKQTQIIVQAETQMKQAEIDLRTSEINQRKAKIEADALLITKRAEAESKRIVMVADGALEQKLAALENINASWANAASQHSMVPTTVIGTNDGKSNSSADFMSLMTAMAAKQVGVDLNVR